MNEQNENVETTEDETVIEVAPKKQVKIRNTTPNIGQFYRARQRVIVPHDRTYDAGKNKAKRLRSQLKG
jgi:hypothetical protein